MLRRALNFRRGLLVAFFCLLKPAHASTTISNTATVNYIDPASQAQSLDSNTVQSTVLPNPTPATISFLRYTTPSGDETLRADGTQCYNGSSYDPAPAPTTLGGGSIDTSSALPFSASSAIRAGEPVFLKVNDLNRNKDPLLRESVMIVVTTQSGDQERLKLNETDIDTGVFVGAINSQRTPPSATAFDCSLSLNVGDKLSVDYVDADFPTDTADANVLIDPYGVVFNSTTGAPIDGVVVSIVHAGSGLPASVFDDDGVTPYPSVITTGGSVTAGSNTYMMPAGSFRFPLMPAGQYRLVISGLPSSSSWPTSIPLGTLDDLTNPATLLPFSLLTGYDGSAFNLVDGPPLNIDIPVDVAGDTDLLLSKSVSKSEASYGDFLRYEIIFKNISAAQADGVVVVDTLPVGLKYKTNSLRIEGLKSSNLTVSGDGRTLNITLGDVPATSQRTISYVTEVSAGANIGPAINYAQATRTNGAPSNVAEATVILREAFFASHATLIGRVLNVPHCDVDMRDTKAVKGVPKVRVLMEDGTYAATDEEGRFHFEKVTPGTHVVQIDQSSIPNGMELAACDKNTRFAGRANSQFVDVAGGTLWRTDFYLKKREIPKGAIDLKFSGRIGLVEGSLLPEALYVVDVAALKDTKNVKIGMSLPQDFSYLPLSALWKDQPVDLELEGTKVVFKIPTLSEGERGVLTFRALPQGDELLLPDSCLKETYVANLDARYEVAGYAGQAIIYTQTPSCGQEEPKVTEGRLNLPAPKGVVEEDQVLSDIEVSGAGRNWVKDQVPGVAILFPETTYNPRAPSSRIVIKHGKNQTVDLRVNGEAVSQLLFERVHSNADKSVNASEWRGVPLKEGDNVIEAGIIAADGSVVQLLKRTIHYSNIPERIVYVPEKSRLKANGIDKPRIAIRVLDRAGKPVRKGIRGSFTLNNPYVPAQFEDYAKRRQLSALDRFEPEYFVETDDGVAYIDLAPTNEAGEVKVKLYLDERRTIDIATWLEPAVEDWVVVGFAEGTAGYETLKGNMTGVKGADKNKELNIDDQYKLYAKGRVSGQWIATVAYDSAKTKDAKNSDFKNIVNPNEFYTLYGDNTTQRNDAPSSDKLYLKLERSRFYALFGDYDAGLNETELARYNRSYTGVKSEYSGEFLGFKIFGTQQDSFFYKDEMQAQSIALNYRLTKGNILVNSEKIRLVVRDRFRSDVIVKDQLLSRHIDYSIDYRAGTINFKRTVDAFVDMNPQFIVAEYETMGVATRDYSYGGRVEGKALEDKVKVGFTHIEEDEGLTSSNLQGVDVKVKLAEQTEVKLEAAQSAIQPGGPQVKGEAYRAEVDHRSTAFDANAYVKETGQDFGIGQQAASESGSFKTGAKTSIHATKNLNVNSAYDHQRQTSSNQTQDVMRTDLEYLHKSGSLSLGGQRIQEQRASGDVEANQATAKATQRLFDEKLELQGGIEQNIGSDQSVDYPNRYILQAGYKLTDKVRLIAAQEYADGKQYDASTTRVGFESTPWSGAKLGSTLNQSVSEYGPRTFSTMGLSQSLPIGKSWTFDASVDATKTLKEQGGVVPVNPSQPLTSGGFLGNGGYTEDYIATTAGVTYRAEPWTWNFRVENRMGEVEDRVGAVTNIIHELSKGVVLGTSHQYYRSDFEGGANGQLLQGDFSLAYRPLDSRWTLLDRVKYRYEVVDNAESLPIFGQTTLQGVDNAVSAAIVNNLNINRLSKLRKNQFSIYYGTKMVWDQYDGDRYQSHIDLYGLEVRQDLGEKWDIGLQGSLLSSWSASNMKYSYGPSVGWTPVLNSWMSVGYNFRGFYDRDFDAARYTGQGVYLKLRIKFDEKTLGLKKGGEGEAKK
ncbi:MAG: hypothetical protein R3A80_10755 [Bdellovibrionota bacterium]